MIKIVNVKNHPPFDIYCGRSNKFYNFPQSKWANPFVIGKDGNRPEVIEKHRLWINSQPDLLKSLPQLRDKTIACWCDFPREDCHCATLKELAESKYIKNWFSNILPFESPLIYHRIEYKTVENFYQAMKIPLDKRNLRVKIAEMLAFEAKKNIRDKVAFVWRDDWTKEMALQVMKYALKWKFQKGTDWYRKLKLTKELGLELVEWNNWGDKFWGKDLQTGDGLNHLGKILTEIRDNE